MSELLTAAQMKAIEQVAIERGEVTGLELMERAGRGVVDAVFEEWPELAKTSHNAVVLCGPGNNGGDGFVVARLLKEWGWEVEVFLYGDAGKLPPDALVNYKRWGEMGAISAIPGAIDTWSADLIIDALFGTGLTRAIEGELYTWLVGLVNHIHGDQHVCAVDAPSGICMDSGRVLSKEKDGQCVLRADLTVTFGARKIGHLVGEGAAFGGRLATNDIGLSNRCRRKALQVFHGVDKRPLGLKQYIVYETWVEASDFAKGRFSLLQHKYSHGHALILTGGSGKTGAARLSARGALRIGAGVVTLGVPPSAQMEVASNITALMLTRVADGDALGEVLQDARINALCLGPGMGLDERAAGLIAAALGATRPGPCAGASAGEVPAQGRDVLCAVVLDADALTLLARDDALFAMLHPECVLTPHAGEFTRLFPDIAARLVKVPKRGPAYSKVDATREAAKRAGCVVLFKGADTVIAAPGGRCSINSAHYERAAPWLATAGSGDVLAGFITGLLARGIAPMQAAEMAAWLHVECAREFGPGLIAEDIPEVLPTVFRKLGL